MKISNLPRLMRISCAIFPALFGVNRGGAEEKDPPRVYRAPWKMGEKLTFDVKWGIVPAGEGVLWIKDASRDRLSGETIVHFVATAKSNSVLDMFYKVRDINESWLDTSQWVSRRFEQHNHEGKWAMDESVIYDWKEKKFKDSQNVKGREPKVTEGALTIPAVDTLSSLYLARSRPLKEGDDFAIDVHSDKNWPILVRVLKRETVHVPAGTFDCFLVEPTLKERGIFIQKGRKLQVWMTADKRQIPVMMRAEIFIGHVSAELKELKESD